MFECACAEIKAHFIKIAEKAHWFKIARREILFRKIKILFPILAKTGDWPEKNTSGERGNY